MTSIVFNKLTSCEKWDRYKDMNDDFYCPNCSTRTDKPYRASPFPGAKICCSNCDYTLTRRTGGGQLDPFNWHYGKPPKKTATIGASRIGLMGSIFRATYPDGDIKEFKAETWLEAVREIAGHATKLEVIGKYEIIDEDD